MADSFRRAKHSDEPSETSTFPTPTKPDVGEETFLTNETSFWDKQPSSRIPTKFATPAPTARPSSGPNKRGGLDLTRASRSGGVRGNARGTRGNASLRGKLRSAK